MKIPCSSKIGSILATMYSYERYLYGRPGAVVVFPISGICFFAAMSALYRSTGGFSLVIACSFLICNANYTTTYLCDTVGAMTQKQPPAPSDPHDYAHPNPPNSTHLWDRYGLAKILQIRPRGIERISAQVRHIKAEGGLPGPKSNFYALADIIEWDKQQPNRRLTDNGRHRKVTDNTGQVWVDDEPAYRGLQAARLLHISYGMFRQRVSQNRDKNPEVYADRKSTRLNSSHVAISYA